MVALISLDGIVPLGPDFLGKVAAILQSTGPKELEDSRLYRNIQEFIPGNSTAEKLNLRQTVKWRNLQSGASA